MNYFDIILQIRQKSETNSSTLSDVISYAEIGIISYLEFSVIPENEEEEKAIRLLSSSAMISEVDLSPTADASAITTFSVCENTVS